MGRYQLRTVWMSSVRLVLMGAAPAHRVGPGDGPNGWRLRAGALWSQQKIPFCDARPGAAQTEPRAAPADRPWMASANGQARLRMSTCQLMTISLI